MSHMHKMLNCFSCFMMSFRTPFVITDFREVRYVSSEMPYENEFFENSYRKPGGILLEYYNHDDVKIGYIRYYITITYSTFIFNGFYVTNNRVVYIGNPKYRQTYSRVLVMPFANTC